MTVKEMHIEVQLATQNIASNTRRKLLAEEIDWLLNKNQQRFIEARLTPRKDGSGAFEINQTEVDAVRVLLRSFTATPHIEGNQASIPLPGDYVHLISDRSLVNALCGQAAPSVSTSTRTVLKIPITPTEASSGFYSSVTLQIGTTSINLASIAQGNLGAYTGLRSKDEWFTVAQVLLWHLRAKGIEAYWERYEDIQAPRTMLIPDAASGTLTVDGTVTVGTTDTVSYSTYNVNGLNWVSNRLTASDKIGPLLDTPYHTTSARSPISELRGDELVIHTDPSWIVTQTQLIYVRVPRLINLSLGEDCELPATYHPAVCDLTVEYFKQMTADPNWEAKLRDNMLRSPLTGK